MAYSQTSAANPKALLAAIVVFATAQGWTIDYDHANGTGSTVGGQIALHSGNCFLAMGEQSAIINPVAVAGDGGSFNDGRLYMALSDSFNGNVQYWGHPGSVVTTAADIDRVAINDVWGPMDEVHFFGDSTYIIVVVKCSALRWTCFGFGLIDDKGMGISKPSFAFSNFVEFWNTINSSGRLNASLYHGSYFPMLSANPNALNGLMVRIPNGVLDTSFGFASGAVYCSNITLAENRHSINKLCNPKLMPETTLVNNPNGTFIMDHCLRVRNQPTTGGVPLYVCPMVYHDTTIDLETFLGEIPGIRVCRITAVPTSAELTYGTDVYKVFPWKQRGTPEDAGQNSGTYNNQPNSFDMGYALRKI
jgi:hypothetical protein